MVALDTHLPNACVGYSPSQWLRWTLSYPVHETDRRARLPSGQNTHPQQAASQLQMLYLSTSNNVAIPDSFYTRERFVTIQLQQYRWWHLWRRSIHRQLPRPFYRFGNLPKGGEFAGYVPDG